MAIARIPANTLAEVYGITFGAGAGANQIDPLLILQRVPASLATQYAATISGGAYTLPGGHPFVVGELVKLSASPIATAPSSHPYYWIKSITSGVATLSAIGPASGDAALTATVSSLDIQQIDLPAETAAWGLGTQSTDPDLAFSANLIKNEVTFGAGPRPAIAYTASPGVIFPSGWPGAGELVYGVAADAYTLTNSGGSSIVYRHAVIQMGGGGGTTQGSAASNPAFFPGGADTTILVGGSLTFNIQLGIQGGAAPVGGGGGIS
jgi:hypothetical protein